MTYIKPIILTLLFISTLVVNGQENKIRGSISTYDTANLSILNIYPDSFPNVSVIFKAETQEGYPIWDLTKEKMTVKENDQKCDVISLEQISKNKAINLGVVFDHSGSMEHDESQFQVSKRMTVYRYDANFNLIYPKDYIPPIERAKSAVKEFVTSFNFDKDFISIIGFSTSVDKVAPLTQDINEINSIVDEMKADYSTALYDALIRGIEEISYSKGVNVLVALTDGHDNSSISTWSEVIKRANLNEIPIYIIGLGDVNVDTLQIISDSTNGKFYHIKSSKSLAEIYTLISTQVQAYYELVYFSENFSSIDTDRKVELSFDIDSIYLVSNAADISLPAEVVNYLAQKEKEKEYLMYGGIGVAILITVGTIALYFRRKRKMRPTITNIFPNPSNGKINLEFEDLSGELQVINLEGEIVKTIPIDVGIKEFDLTDLVDGNYIARIQSDNYQSKGVKLIIKK
jgi:Ca-activated chloride channel family protein